jgi:ABC-type Fe3+-hydroxamate transport system substrate-binding protein
LVKLIDDRDKEVSVPEEIKRIISLSPAITEILFELGFGSKVVGVTPFCVRPAEAMKKKKVASYGYASTEQFQKLKPDLILTVTGYQNAVADQLASHFSTFSFGLPSSLSGVIDLVTKVAVVTGQEEKGRDIERQLWESMKRLRVGRKKDVYFECDLGGSVTFGSLSYITDVLGFMNFRSIYSGVPKEWLPPDFDLVKKEDPDYIILEPKMFSKRAEDLVERLIANRGWQNLSAYQNKRVYLTPGMYDFFAHHGPSLIREVLPWLEQIE